METRSSPSVCSLHSLAQEEGMNESEYLHVSKSALFAQLRDSHSYRNTARAVKRPLTPPPGESGPSVRRSKRLRGCPPPLPPARVVPTPPQALKENDDGVAAPAATTATTETAAAAAALAPVSPPIPAAAAAAAGAPSKGKSKTNGKGKGKGKAKRSLASPDIDPITLTPLGRGKRVFRFKRPNGKVVTYNLESLVDWLLSSGDFVEPETRLAFSDVDLRAIDAACSAAGIDRQSVVAAKEDPGRFVEGRVHRDGLLGLERLMGECVSEMMDIVEEATPEEGQLRLALTVFPLFGDLYSQMAKMDEAFAKQCLEHYQAFLKGPPNRPTVDPCGFLPVVSNFLTTTARDGGAADFRR